MRMGRRGFLGLLTAGILGFLINLDVFLDRGRVVTLSPPSILSSKYMDILSISSLKSRSLNQPIPLYIISDILWAAQGISDPILLFRTAPSAGGLYPVDLYLSNDGFVSGLEEGVYIYDPIPHGLRKVSSQPIEGDADIILDLVYSRTASKYGDRAVRYVELELGHILFNLFIESLSYGYIPIVSGVAPSESLGLSGDKSISIIFESLDSRVEEDALDEVEFDSRIGELLLRRRSRRRFSSLSIDESSFKKFIRLLQFIERFYSLFFDAPEILLFLNIVGVEGVDTGLYRLWISPNGYSMHLIGDMATDEIYKACFSVGGIHQLYVTQAMMHLIIASEAYGLDPMIERFRTGFFTQGVVLNTVLLDFASVTVGGFDNKALNKLLDLPGGYDSKYVMPIGWPI